jgi:hypothetical protein
MGMYERAKSGGRDIPTVIAASFRNYGRVWANSFTQPAPFALEWVDFETPVFIVMDSVKTAMIET